MVVPSSQPRGGRRARLLAWADAVPWTASVAVLVAVLALVPTPEALAQAEFRWVPVGEVRFSLEDPPGAAAPTFDDAEWSVGRFRRLDGSPGPRWVRAWVEIPETGGEPGRVWGLRVVALAAHEAYWDGELIGSSGRVGRSAAEEEPGLLSSLHGIPPERARPGRHLLAVRLSSWHAGFRPTQSFYNLALGDYQRFALAPLRAAVVPLVCLGALLVSAVFFLGLGAVDRRRRPELVLGLLSLATVGQLVAECWRLLAPYPYDWHIVRLRLIAGAAFLVGVLLIRFLVLRLEVARGWVWSAVAAAVALLGFGSAIGYDGKTASILLAHLGVGLILAVWAWWGRVKAGRPWLGPAFAAAGIVACLGLSWMSPGEFLDRSIYLGEGVILLGLLLAHAWETRETRRRHEAARLTNLRLELELLKRYLNPHFLMNSLTALVELFEDRPRLAGPAIEALAAEVRTLGDMAARREVTVGEELALCRAHLAVMGFRQDRRFVLGAQGVDERRRIPPAIFHTVLENALTHNRYADGTTFRLWEERDGDWTVYRLAVPHAGRATASDRGSGRVADERRGAGLRYIEARLRERHGEDWRLESRPEGAEWWTTIQVPFVASVEGVA